MQTAAVRGHRGRVSSLASEKGFKAVVDFCAYCSGELVEEAERSGHCEHQVIKQDDVEIA